MRSKSAKALLIGLVLPIVCANESFDNFVLSYGDFERCTFGIGRYDYYILLDIL